MNTPIRIVEVMGNEYDNQGDRTMSKIRPVITLILLVFFYAGVGPFFEKHQIIEQPAYWTVYGAISMAVLLLVLWKGNER